MSVGNSLAVSIEKNYTKLWNWVLTSIMYAIAQFDALLRTESDIFFSLNHNKLMSPWKYPSLGMPSWSTVLICFINTLRLRQNGRHRAGDTFKRIFLNENIRISIKISLKFVPEGPINNIPALVQIMAWRRSGNKPLSEPMMVSSLTYICVTWPQWVNMHKQV